MCLKKKHTHSVQKLIHFNRFYEILKSTKSKSQRVNKKNNKILYIEEKG